MIDLDTPESSPYQRARLRIVFEDAVDVYLGVHVKETL